MIRRLLFAAVALALIATASPALARPGLQLGFSTNPDDFIVGVHFRAAPMGENLELVPSAELGFGDATMIAGNADLHYLLPVQSKLKPYVGGGITLNWFDLDEGSETDFGGSILGGVHLNEKFSAEAKLGLGDVPDW